MVRNLLILLVFLGVGLGAHAAQSDIFVRQNFGKKKEVTKSEEPPPLFLRPSVSQKNKERAGKNRYNQQLDISLQRAQTINDLKTLAYWQQRKLEPQTVDEMRSFAIALRAENRSAMIAQRDKALPGLIKLQKKRDNDFEIYMSQQEAEKEARNRAAVARGVQLVRKREEKRKADYVRDAYALPSENVDEEDVSFYEDGAIDEDIGFDESGVINQEDVPDEQIGLDLSEGMDQSSDVVASSPVPEAASPKRVQRIYVVPKTTLDKPSRVITDFR